MRELALTLSRRSPDELTDAEHLLRQTDSYWWLSYCLTTFGTTPERVDQWMLCREHTQLQAHAIVSDAYQRLTKTHRHYWRNDAS